MEDKQWLFGKTLGELQEIVAEKGMPRFAAKQIATWLYRKGVDSIDRMTDLSLKNREALQQEFQVGRLPYAAVEESSDGTKKYLFPTLGGRYIESAYIPDADRATLCVSSQSGCKMGCRFCMTARQGFAHHLTTGEILNQMAEEYEVDPVYVLDMYRYGKVSWMLDFAIRAGIGIFPLVIGSAIAKRIKRAIRCKVKEGAEP